MWMLRLVSRSPAHQTAYSKCQRHHHFSTSRSTGQKGLNIVERSSTLMFRIMFTCFIPIESHMPYRPNWSLHCLDIMSLISMRNMRPTTSTVIVLATAAAAMPEDEDGECRHCPICQCCLLLQWRWGQGHGTWTGWHPVQCYENESFLWSCGWENGDRVFLELKQTNSEQLQGVFDALLTNDTVWLAVAFGVVRRCSEQTDANTPFKLHLFRWTAIVHHVVQIECMWEYVGYNRFGGSKLDPLTLNVFSPGQVDVDIIRLGEEDNACSVCYETQDVSALAGVTRPSETKSILFSTPK